MSTNLTLEIGAHIDIIAAALRSEGWVVVPNFLSISLRDRLLADCKQRRAEFVEAAVGRGNTRRHSSDQRSDVTLWLRDTDTVQRDFLRAMDFLRGELNRCLYLGLRDYEAHYAHYAPGAFYRRHRDAFAQARANATSPQRVVSSVYYLNTSAHGGELVLYSSEQVSSEYISSKDIPLERFASAQDQRELLRITPVAGTAVFFLSAEFPHEVLPAQSDRYSIAGWFRD